MNCPPLKLFNEEMREALKIWTNYWNIFLQIGWIPDNFWKKYFKIEINIKKNGYNLEKILEIQRKQRNMNELKKIPAPHKG